MSSFDWHAHNMDFPGEGQGAGVGFDILWAAIVGLRERVEALEAQRHPPSPPRTGASETDLVGMLRAMGVDADPDAALFNAAADRIAQLEAALEAARDEFDEIWNMTDSAEALAAKHLADMALRGEA